MLEYDAEWLEDGAEWLEEDVEIEINAPTLGELEDAGWMVDVEYELKIDLDDGMWLVEEIVARLVVCTVEELVCRGFKLEGTGVLVEEECEPEDEV